MHTGFEETPQKTLEALVNNLKSGAMQVVDMGEAAHIARNSKECPPVAAFQLNMTLLSMFEAEFLRRGLDFDAFVGPQFRQVIDMWLETE